MSVARALSRLAARRAVLAPLREGGGYGVFPLGDRRKRPVVRLAREEVQALAASGALTAAPEAGTYVLSEAGEARVAREGAAPGEDFIAQHAPVVPRNVINASGAIRSVRSVDSNDAIRRLARMRDSAGAPWLDAEELSAAMRLRADWLAGQAGLVRGSDWTAPPQSRGARGPGNAVEDAILRHADARKRVSDALSALAPPLRRVVERVCLHEDGLEALERAQGWPSRSGKLALKMGLAQLAAMRV